MTQWYAVKYPKGASRSRIALPAGGVILPGRVSDRSWHTIKPPGVDGGDQGVSREPSLPSPKGVWLYGLAVVLVLVSGILLMADGIGSGQADISRFAGQYSSASRGFSGGADRLPATDMAEESTETPVVSETAESAETEETNEETEAAEISFTSLGSGEVIRMLATAYTLECGNGDGVTATGTTPRPGIIAVDPRVIPHDTLVYIDDYGYFRAEDTGGVIKGHRIDVFMHSREDALNFGKRWVDVKIIGRFEEPGLVKRFP